MLQYRWAIAQDEGRVKGRWQGWMDRMGGGGWKRRVLGKVGRNLSRLTVQLPPLLREGGGETLWMEGGTGGSAGGLCRLTKERSE